MILRWKGIKKLKDSCGSFERCKLCMRESQVELLDAIAARDDKILKNISRITVVVCLEMVEETKLRHRKDSAVPDLVFKRG